MIGYLIGWVGVFWGLLVAPPQLWKIIKTGRTDGISLMTYIFLFLALLCYLIHAISIKSPVFVVAQSLNLVTNGIILWLLIKARLCALGGKE